MACCKKALDSPNLDASLKGSFFYTEAMALEGAGDMASARSVYERLAQHAGCHGRCPPDCHERMEIGAPVRAGRR
jgi:hypothetical protein